MPPGAALEAPRRPGNRVARMRRGAQWLIVARIRRTTWRDRARDVGPGGHVS